jgi:membrane associated rhomboid family serine protease
MDLNHVLMWMSGVSCAFNLWHVLQMPRESVRGWRWVLTTTLLLLGLGVLMVPSAAGYVAGGLWLVLVMLPIGLQKLMHKNLVARRYRLAMLCARLSAWLHPCDGWPAHPQMVSVLQQAQANRPRESRTAGVSTARAGTRPWMTRSIALVLIGVFVVELPGGSTNTANLVELGALVIPTSATPGEWWRTITAGLLHFGPMHLALNLIGLFYFGSRLERAWRGWPLLVCFAVTSITAMTVAPLLVTREVEQTGAILVGASGGVMGLLGATLGHLVHRWRQERTEDRERQIGRLLMIVGLQTLFDLTTPNVSLSCHLLGLGTGCLFAVLLELAGLPRVPIRK